MAILAILFVLAGAFLWRMRRNLGHPLGTRLAVFQWLFIIGGTLLFTTSMARVVSPGHAGVVVLFGRVKDGVLPSGLHFVNPFSDVEELEIRTRSYTMSGVHEEGQKAGDDSIAVITSDGLTVKLDATVLYALEQARCAEIFRNLGPQVEDRIIRPEIRTALRDNAATYSATELYTTKRGLYVDQVTKALKPTFDRRGIVLDQVLLRNVLLPDQITRAINDKIAADQEAQKMTYVLQKEKQEAERKRIEAEGQARAQQIVSASLTPQILEYQRIQALRAIGDKGNLIISGTGGTPLIQVPSHK
jgi:regulator of protease activity HflC (stomatin/prohibitin superfamily)